MIVADYRRQLAAVISLVSRCLFRASHSCPFCVYHIDIVLLVMDDPLTAAVFLPWRIGSLLEETNTVNVGMDWRGRVPGFGLGVMLSVQRRCKY